MTPGSFDAETSREMVGHERALVIEAKARVDADKGTFDPPAMTEGSYWSRCQGEFDFAVYKAQYDKRIEKAARATEEVTVDPALQKLIEEAVASEAKAVEQFKSGKEKALNSVVGKVIGAAKKAGLAADALAINAAIKAHIK